MHLQEHLKDDRQFNATLHGAKMKGALERQEFDEQSHETLQKLGNKKYEEMMAEWEAKQKNNG